MFDFLIADNCGMPYDSESLNYTGVGGSESQAIWLLEALAEKGLTVGSMNRVSHFCIGNKVSYIPLDMDEQFETNVLILQRYSKIPKNVKYKKIFRHLHDNPQGVDFENDGIPLIAVSNWQKSVLTPDKQEKCIVIPNLVPDFVYDIKPTRNNPVNSFFYGSAMLKGGNETVNAYIDISKGLKNASMGIACPIWSTISLKDPAINDLPKHNVKFLGSLPFKKFIKEYSNYRNYLYISNYRETFGLSPLFGEILGLNMFILRLQGKDAMSEILNSPVFDNKADLQKHLNNYKNNSQSFTPVKPKDFRASTILPQWLSLLTQ